MNELPVASSPAILSYRSHPAREFPGRAAIAALVIVASGVFATLYMQSAGFGALATAIMVMSLAKFFFPTTYSFDEKGVAVKTVTQSFTREWTRFHSFYGDPSGVLLSPFARPSRLESFRGLYITFSGNREEVMAVVTRFIGASAGTLPANASPATEKTT